MNFLSLLGIGTDIKHKDHAYHETLTNVMLVIAAGILGFFSLVHIFYGQYIMALVQFTLSAVYLFTYLGTFGEVKQRNKEKIVVIGTIALFLYLLIDGGIAKTGIYWIPFFPFMLFAVAGLQRGLRWVGLFAVGVIIVEALDYRNILDTPYSFHEILFFSIAFVFYVVVGMIFEALRVRQQDELELKNDHLEDMRHKLHQTLSTLEQEIEKRTFELKESNRQLAQEVENHKTTNQNLKATEQKFYQAQKMEALGTLVGGIAHDFNSVLSGINANLFLVQRKVKDKPDIQPALDDIEKMVFHAAEMTKQLLAFARKDTVEKQQFDMRTFMTQGIKLAAAALPSRIQLKTNIATTPLPVFGSTTQLQQVLMNLVNNARDALSSVENPVIHIDVSQVEDSSMLQEKHPDLQDKSWVKVTVSDNGVGIQEKDIPHVFDPFFTTKEAGSGTGLGLSMCYGAIQSHGGVIEVESKPNQGCAFHIYLPLDQGSNADTLIQSVGEALQGKGETILMVDDDDTLCQAQKSVLENLGYQVIIAHNGFEAIKAYAEAEPEVDVVVMDIMMPEMGGIKAAQHILTMNDKAKIIFASGYEKDSSTERFLSQGFSQVDAIKRLSKPFTIQQLCHAIRRELD